MGGCVPTSYHMFLCPYWVSAGGHLRKANSTYSSLDVSSLPFIEFEAFSERLCSKQ